VTAAGSLGFTILVLFIVMGTIAYYLEGRFPLAERPIRAFEKMKEAIGRSVESGERVHLSLGTGPVAGVEGGPGLAGLALLARLVAMTRVSDLPMIASTADGALMLLAQASLRAVAQAAPPTSGAEVENGRMIAATAFSYAAAIPSLVETERVSAHFLFGRFRQEAALVALFGRHKGASVVGGTDDVLAQALLFATADYPAIGEEFYAAPAYLGGEKAQRAGLRAEDSIRILLVIAILIGTILKTLGVMP
jgi:hypothetical protein